MFFFIDPVGGAIHHLVTHGIAGHLDFGVVLELLDEDVPIAHEGDHTTIRAEGRYHHLARGGAQRLDTVASHVIVEGIPLGGATIDGFLIRDDEDVIPFGLKDVVIEGFELAFACLLDAKERIDELSCVEAVA